VRRVRPTAVRVAFALALLGSVLAVALCFRTSPAHFTGFAAAAVLVLALPYLEWVSPPAPLVRVLPRLSTLVLLVVALVAWLSRSLSTLNMDPSLLPAAAAPFLVPIAAVFALAPRSFVLGRTLVPATIGLLVLGGLDPTPAGYGGTLLPFLKPAAHNGFADVYLALALLVLAALWTAAFLAAGPRWRRRDVLGLIVAGVLALALAATGVIGLPLLQPRIERAVASMLDQPTTGLSGESTLGEFAELASSNRRVLDLRTSLPEQPPSRLRSEAFTVFDGRRWSPAPPVATATRLTVLAPASAPASVGPLLVDTGAWFRLPGEAEPSVASDIRIVQAEVNHWPILLPKGVVAVTIDSPFLEFDRLGAIRRPAATPGRLYGALWPPSLAPSAAPPPLSEDDRRESLALPPHVDERVVALARELAQRGKDPAARVVATVAHLQLGYAYTLRPGPFRTEDPVAEFLFDKKAGYCEYFASAAVVLLRLQGVPTRFVKGLSLGPHTDEGGGLHVVRDRDAHAWIEAWLPGAGWIEADPTPPGQFAAAHPPAGGLERVLQRTRAALASAWTVLTARGPLAFAEKLARDAGRLAARLAGEPLVWLAVAALVMCPQLLRFARARRRLRDARAMPEPAALAVPLDLRALVRDLERRWSAAGLARPAGRGLLEHARRVADARSTPRPSPAAIAGPRIVAAYYRSRFGSEAISTAECIALHEALDTE
jgi:Transglutaminase-like superfamily/TgpA N-terminal domain